jgi:hypothetical protein
MHATKKSQLAREAKMRTKIFHVVALSLSFSLSMGFAQDADTMKQCNKLAIKTIREQKTSYAKRYVNEEMEATLCKLTPNKGAIECEVSACKSNCAALDAWRVILSKSCKKVYGFKLIGEE